MPSRNTGMSTTSSRSGFRRFCCFAIFASAPLAVSAVEPLRDYAIPLTIVADTGEAHGVTLVDAADFDATAAVVPDTAIVSQTHVLYGGTPGVDRRPYALIYQQDGHWMRIGLRSGLSPVPQQVSSAGDADTACASNLIETTQGSTPDAMLVYSLPGPDDACGTPDDRFRRIGLDDSGDQAPVTVPVTTLALQPVYVSGTLVAVLAHEDGQLRRYPANLSSATVVQDAATVVFAGQRADGTSFVVIDGILRKVSKEGTTPWTAVKRPQRNYAIAQVMITGETMWIFEDAVSGSEQYATRVYRLDVNGGSLLAVAILNLAVHSVYAGVTDTRLLYLQGGGVDPATGAQIPHELRSVPQDTNQFGTDGKRIYRIARGYITVVAIRGDRIFFNVIDRTEETPYLHADARLDDGQTLRNGAKGSAWLDAKPGTESATTLVLAANAANLRTLAGADLYRFDAVTLEPTLIRELKNGTRPGRLSGTGPATAENFVDGDAFVLDVAEGRFRRFTGVTALR